MVYKGRSHSCLNWRKREARELSKLKDSFLIPIAGSVDGPGVALSDDELRFIGWMLTDGHRNPSNNAIIIAQSSESPYLRDIEATLQGCGFGYRRYQYNRRDRFAKYPPIVQFCVPYGQPRGVNRGLKGWKHLAEYFDRPILETLGAISKKQIRVLLHAMNLGDGSKPKHLNWNKKTMDLCMGEHKFLVDQLQALLISRGFRCNIATENRRTNWHINAPKLKFVLHVREQQAATLAGVNYRYANKLVRNRARFGPLPFDPSEMVWCLRTSLGTLVTRRNGKVAVVGNCGRGFRLHPSKQNCLVLDFGGNVLRHGPVDCLRIKPAGNQSSGEAPAKQCPKCHALIAMGYATCPECGFVFPPREKQNHEAKPTEAAILSGQVTTTRYEVTDTQYYSHLKRGAADDAPRSMRVDYMVGWRTRKSEWICFEHSGYARQRAVAWWKQRSPDPVPATTDEALERIEGGALAQTLAIVIRNVSGDEYERIIDYELGPMPDPLDEEDQSRAIPDEEVPF
jgi:hypothetical protein